MQFTLPKPPWVTRLRRVNGELPPCEGYRYSKMPLKALYGNEEQRAHKEDYQCKNKAHWRFREGNFKRKDDFLSGDRGKAGVYCTTHMVSVISTLGQQGRYNTWYLRWGQYK